MIRFTSSKDENVPPRLAFPLLLRYIFDLERSKIWASDVKIAKMSKPFLMVFLGLWSKAVYFIRHIFHIWNQNVSSGDVLGRMWRRQQNQRCQLTNSVPCKFGSILFSFRDMPTGRTTDDGLTSATIACLAVKAGHQWLPLISVDIRNTSCDDKDNCNKKKQRPQWPARYVALSPCDFHIPSRMILAFDLKLVGNRSAKFERCMVFHFQVYSAWAQDTTDRQTDSVTRNVAS